MGKNFRESRTYEEAVETHKQRVTDAIEYFENYCEFDIPEEEKTSVNKLIERVKAKV